MRACAAVLILSLGLAGCAAPFPSYEGAGAATLQLQNRSSNPTQLLTFADLEACQKLQPLAVAPGSDGLKDTLQTGESGSIRLAPGRRFAAGFTTTTPVDEKNAYKFCTVAAIFTPLAGKTYTASFRILKNACHIDISEQRTVAGDMAIAEPVPFRYVRYYPETFIGPAMCL
jgi:hypothetical protein